MNENRFTLGTFLKIRRQSLQPEDVGLPAGLRRRTPGLKREEAALLAGLSLTWYTLLEQGKAKGVSAQALHGLARAFNLTSAEVAYMYQLAGVALPVAVVAPNEDIAGTLQQLIDGQQWPAYVIDYQWNIIAWNRAAVRLYDDFGKLNPKERNILRYILLNPAQKQRLPDWEKEAAGAVALFRSATVLYNEESWHRELRSELQEKSSQFKLWWDDYTIIDGHDRLKRIRTDDGIIEVATVVMTVQGNPGLQIHIQIPR